MWHNLCRGMAPRPGDRYPSMKALLRALGRDPSRTKSYILYIAMFALLFFLIGYALWAQPT